MTEAEAIRRVVFLRRRLAYLNGPDSPIFDPHHRRIAARDVAAQLNASKAAWERLRGARRGHTRMPTQHRSVLLNIKGVIDDRREFEGWASTAQLDMLGDVLEPRGAEWSRLPLPCLFQHDHSSPVGEISHIEARSTGLWVHGRIDKDDRPGPLAELLDKAWGFVRRRLIKSLSVGFQPLASTPLPNGGKRFTRWRVYEISLVSCPANAAATIETVRANRGA